MMSGGGSEATISALSMLSSPWTENIRHLPALSYNESIPSEIHGDVLAVLRALHARVRIVML